MNFLLFFMCPEVMWLCIKHHYTLNQTHTCACSPPQRASRLVNPVKRKVGCKNWIHFCMTSALRGREGVSQFLTKGREVAWIGTDKWEGGGPKSRNFSRRHMYMPPFLNSRSFQNGLSVRARELQQKWCTVTQVDEQTTQLIGGNARLSHITVSRWAGARRHRARFLPERKAA